MIESLFGDLDPPLGGSRPPGLHRLAGRPEPVDAVGDTALASTLHDVVVDSAPAVAMREHFARHRGDLDSASPMITLIDPSQLWAPQVVQALSEAAGQPLQRLNLRDRHTLRTLAVIERTLVPRRGQAPLRVYCTDIRTSGSEAHLRHDEIASALAEGSQLTAVLVGTLQPQALTALLLTLLAASQHPAWRCPRLLFLVPSGSSGARQRILAQPWPAGVDVDVVAEPLGSASGVWNRLLAAWEGRGQGRLPPAPAAPAAPNAAAIIAIEPSAATTPQAPEPPPLRPSTQALRQLMWPLQRTDGVIASGVIDLLSGDLLISQCASLTDDDSAALNDAAQTLWRAREGCRQALGGQPGPDEILLTVGARQLLLRPLPTEPALGFVALVSRAQVNLALLRFKLLALMQTP